ncbi:MAG: hypothetical protein HY975_03195 [Candidatus Kerfeldbacteria bacterium]|nr:hypothetical protein [Candidatus Kerfeldbacteria bacterium]
METHRPLVYLVVDDAKYFQALIDALERCTPYEYKILPHFDLLFNRLRLGSTRPRVIILDDGHPFSRTWVGADIYRKLRAEFGPDTPPVIVTTTNIRQARDGFGEYTDELRSLGLTDIFIAPNINPRELAATITQRTSPTSAP